MFDKLASLFRSKPAAAAQTDPMTQQRSAVAALLVEAARADNVYEDREKTIIDRVLASRFEIEPTQAASLRQEGELLQERAVDLHAFTKSAKEMPPPEKISLIESLWEIVLSDGAKDAHEDALMRRLCGLLYVDDKASGEARQRVQARLRA